MVDTRGGREQPCLRKQEAENLLEQQEELKRCDSRLHRPSFPTKERPSWTQGQSECPRGLGPVVERYSD